MSLLEVIATAGDGLYYFLDQYNWCVAAGLRGRAGLQLAQHSLQRPCCSTTSTSTNSNTACSGPSTDATGQVAA